MIIIKNLIKRSKSEDLEYCYSYKVIKTLMNEKEIYGIEVERADYKNDIVVNIERDSIPIISPNKEKVIIMAEKLYENLVSPIHLVNVLGEEVDKCVYDFDKVCLYI